HQRLPVTNVREVVAGHVEHREQEPEALHGFHVCALGLEGFDVEVRNRVDRRNAVRGEGVDAGGGVGQDVPHEFLDLGRVVAGVVVEAFELHGAAGAVVGHLVRAGPDRVGIAGVVAVFHRRCGNDLHDGGVGPDVPHESLDLGRVVPDVVVEAFELHGAAGAVVGHLVRAGPDRVGIEGVEVFFHRRLGNDLHDGDALLENTDGVFEVELHGRVIGGFHRFDEGDELAVERVVVRVEYPVEGEHDVVGGHRGAVVEDRAFAQGGGVGGLVHFFEPVGCERVVRFAVGGVEFGQALERVPVDGDGQRRRRGHRVVTVGPELVADPGPDGAIGISAALALAIGIGGAFFGGAVPVI